MSRKKKNVLGVAKAIGKQAIRTAQTIRTGKKLAKRVTNPLALAKVVKTAAKGEGIVLPGSKYIGPGNRMDKGTPTSRADALAYQHDIDYDNYIKAGVPAKKVYTGYSDADSRLRSQARKTMHKDPNALAAFAGMSAKKLLAKSGLTKRIRDRDVYGQSGKPAIPSEYQSQSDKYQLQFTT